MNDSFQPHGTGQIYNAKGELVEGCTFQNGRLHGKGFITYEDGSKFVGEVVQGRKEGWGKFTQANGDTYTGFFKNDLKHGRGTFVWADGDKYEGDWLNGKGHGCGKYTWPDGSVYLGEHVQDQLCGLGLDWSGTANKGTSTKPKYGRWAMGELKQPLPLPKCFKGKDSSMTVDEFAAELPHLEYGPVLPAPEEKRGTKSSSSSSSSSSTSASYVHPSSSTVPCKCQCPLQCLGKCPCHCPRCVPPARATPDEWPADLMPALLELREMVQRLHREQVC